MTRIEWQDVTAAVKRAVPLRQAFEMLGWRVRHGKRADCGLCTGSRRETVSFSDSKRLWKCQRCGAGGDIFTLVEKAHGCDFKTALQFLATQAGIELPTGKRLGHAERMRIVRREAERQARDAKARKLKQKERALVKWSISWIHFTDDLLALPGPWNDEQWVARMAAELRDEYLLPEFTLLTYAPASVSKRYLEADEVHRMAMLVAVRNRGGVVTEDGHFEEVA